MTMDLSVHLQSSNLEIFALLPSMSYLILCGSRFAFLISQAFTLSLQAFVVVVLFDVLLVFLPWASDDIGLMASMIDVLTTNNNLLYGFMLLS